MSATDDTTPGAAAPTPSKTRKTRVVLTPAQRSEVVTLWKTGAVDSIAGLARRFNVSREAIESTLDKAGARDKKGEVVKVAEKKAEAAMATVLSIEPALIAQRAYDTKNETYRLLEMIRKLVGKEIVDARQAGKPLGAIQNEIKTLREAAQTIKVCREEAYAILGINPDKEGDDDDLPELKVSMLTQDQILALQKSPSEDDLSVPDMDLDLTVVGQGDGASEDPDEGDHIEGDDA